MLSVFFLLYQIVKKPFVLFKTFSWKKKLIVIITVLLLSGFVLSNIIKNAQKPVYKTVSVSKSNITEFVSETGTIEAIGRTDVYSPAAGIVENVYIKNGDRVSVGQELLTVKSTATEQEKAQAQAAYLLAQNALDTANASLNSLQSTMISKWDTYKRLAESDSYENADGTPKSDTRANPEYHIAEKDWIAAESNYKKQKTVISQAQAAVRSAYLLYQATQNATVKATNDGIVANLSVTTGSSVKANSVTTPTQPLATITASAATEAVVFLTENDIAKVEEGQSAEIEVNAANNKKYNGIVSRVDTIGRDDKGVIRYNVYVTIKDADSRLRAGMNVDVRILTKKVINVLSVPNAAIKPYRGGKAVRVLGENGEITYIPVQIGIKGEEKTEIRKGIVEGQQVITSLSNEQIKRPGLFGS